MSTEKIRLKRIELRDFSLLREAAVDLQPGLTVITGESGAGKTLLFDAVAFALGERSQRGLLAQGASSCEVKLSVELGEGIAQELGPPWHAGDNKLARRLNASGRSRLTLNGESLPVAQAQAAGERLFEITGQFESRVLFNAAAHLKILDAFSDTKLPPLLIEYKAGYSRWRSLAEQLAILRESTGQRAQEIDFLRFQVAELDKAAVQTDERDDVAAQLKVAQNAEELRLAASQAARLLDGDDEHPGAFDLAAQAEAQISELGRLLAGARLGALDPDDLGARATELLEGLRELASQCRGAAESIHSDPAEAQRLADRLDEILRLERKYSCGADELPGLLEEKQARLGLLTDETQSPDALERQLKAEEKKLTALAAKLTKLRRGAGVQLQKTAAGYLAQLGFTHVELQVSIEAATLGPDGADNVEFLVSLNPGEPTRPLARVASGGETSRLMLAIKAALAERLGFGVLLLDEVEAGLGGDTALKVAQVLKQLAATRQVVAITHLPMVAVQGQTHLIATKSVQDDRASVVLTELGGGARRGELARMLGDTGGKEEQALIDKLLAEAAE